MKIIKGFLVLAFAVTLFSSCMEEDYVRPSTDIENAQSGDERSIPTPPPPPSPK